MTVLSWSARGGNRNNTTGRTGPNASGGASSLDALSDAISSADKLVMGLSTTINPGPNDVILGPNVLTGYVGAASGYSAGNNNVAIGANALQLAVGGQRNVVIGALAMSREAGSSYTDNVVVGYGAAIRLRNGTCNVAIGQGAGPCGAIMLRGWMASAISPRVSKRYGL